MASIQQASTEAKVTRQSVQFNIRMDIETKGRIERAARAAHQSLTEFTQTALAKRADEVLAEQEKIVLSDRDYELFVQIMTSETEPTAIALKEAAEYRQGVREGNRYRW